MRHWRHAACLRARAARGTAQQAERRTPSNRTRLREGGPALRERAWYSRTDAASETATSSPSGDAATASTCCGPLSSMRARWRGPSRTSTGAPSSCAQPLTLTAWPPAARSGRRGAYHNPTLPPLSAMRARWRGQSRTSTGAPSSCAQPLTLAAWPAAARSGRRGAYHDPTLPARATGACRSDQGWRRSPAVSSAHASAHAPHGPLGAALRPRARAAGWLARGTRERSLVTHQPTPPRQHLGQLSAAQL